MGQGIAFTHVRLTNPTDRLVVSGEGFKAAGSGHIGDRIVNVVKETFFKGTVRQENAKAYEQARSEWSARHGGESQAVAKFFDAKITTGARFDAAARAELLGLPALSYTLVAGESGTANQLAVHLAGLADTKPSADFGAANRTPVASHPGATIGNQMLADLPRCAYTLQGEVLTVGGRFVPDGSSVSAQKPEERADLADKVGGRLIALFGAEYAEGISNCAQQALGAPILHLLGADDTTPLRFPDGTPVVLQGVNLGVAIHISKNSDGSPHIHCDAGFSVAGQGEAWHKDVGGHLSEDSAALLSYGFDLAKSENAGEFVIRNVTPISFSGHMRPTAQV